MVSKKEKKNPQKVHLVSLSGGAANALKPFMDDNTVDKISCINATSRSWYPSKVNFVPIHLSSPNNSRDEQFWWHNHEIRHLPRKISTLFESNQLYVLLVSLGGVQGSLLARKIYRYLIEKKRQFAIIGSIPFRFESANIYRGYEVARDLADDSRVKLFPLEDIRRKYGKINLTEAFKMADQTFYEKYKDIMSHDSGM